MADLCGCSSEGKGSACDVPTRCSPKNNAFGVISHIRLTSKMPQITRRGCSTQRSSKRVTMEMEHSRRKKNKSCSTLEWKRSSIGLTCDDSSSRDIPTGMRRCVLSGLLLRTHLSCGLQKKQEHNGEVHQWVLEKWKVCVLNRGKRPGHPQAQLTCKKRTNRLV